MGLEVVWHPECFCGVKGPWPAHETVEAIPAKIARVKCRCDLDGRRHIRAERDDEYDPSEDSSWPVRHVGGGVGFRDHQRHQEERRCKCFCHGWPDCMDVHADRRCRSLYALAEAFQVQADLHRRQSAVGQ